VAAQKFRTSLSHKLDSEIEDAAKEMERLDPPKGPIHIDKPGDGPLGGTMKIKGPWRRG